MKTQKNNYFLKDFDGWNIRKKALHNRRGDLFYHEETFNKLKTALKKALFNEK